MPLQNVAEYSYQSFALLTAEPMPKVEFCCRSGAPHRRPRGRRIENLKGTDMAILLDLASAAVAQSIERA